MKQKRSHRPLLVIALALVLSAACTTPTESPADRPTAASPQPESSPFTSLFNGTDLDGWHRHLGVPEAYTGGKWEVIDGAIVGDQDPPGKGGFLVTDAKYGDFELTMEIQVDYPNDSGIFLRMGEDGKSHQVTLDNEEQPKFGDIYLPWSEQLTVQESPEGIKHYRQGEWNQVRISIEGEPSRIQFWLNGAHVTDFQHTTETTAGVPAEGYLGLQVHAGDDWQEGKRIRFRNIQIRRLPAVRTKYQSPRLQDRAGPGSDPSPKRSGRGGPSIR